jgi:predicted CXXCH cytochrome family protein
MAGKATGPGRSCSRDRQVAGRGAQRGVPELPSGRPADELEGQHDERQRCRVHRLPHRPRGERSGPGEGHSAGESASPATPRERADSFKYSHHPIREGKVVCSDCHNPHGSPGDTKLLKEFTVNETCYNCHADKRGPMLWEHQPVRDNCLNCHTPHGSNQPRLMKEQMNFLCASCHSAESQQQRRRPSAARIDPVPRAGQHQVQFGAGEPERLPQLPLAGARVEQPGRRLLLLIR